MTAFSNAALGQLAALTGLAALHTGCAATPQKALLDMQLIERDSGVAIAQYPSDGRRFSPGLPGALCHPPDGARRRGDAVNSWQILRKGGDLCFYAAVRKTG